jgi:tetratricopeptide (TPR) repeat protein
MIKSGEILTLKRKWEAAMERFDDVITKFPNTNFMMLAYKKKAEILKSKGELNPAIEYFHKSLGQLGTDIDAEIQFMIGECYEDSNNYNEALKEYLRVSYLYPRSNYWMIKSIFRSANIFERLEKWDEAKKLYEKLIALNIDESKYARERLEWIKSRVEKSNPI